MKRDALYDPVFLLRRCTISEKSRNLQLTKSRDQNDPDYKRTICRENPGRVAVLVSRLVVHQCMCDLQKRGIFFTDGKMVRCLCHVAEGYSTRIHGH